MRRRRRRRRRRARARLRRRSLRPRTPRTRSSPPPSRRSPGWRVGSRRRRRERGPWPRSALQRRLQRVDESRPRLAARRPGATPARRRTPPVLHERREVRQDDPHWHALGVVYAPGRAVPARAEVQVPEPGAQPRPRPRLRERPGGDDLVHGDAQRPRPRWPRRPSPGNRASGMVCSSQYAPLSRPGERHLVQRACTRTRHPPPSSHEARASVRFRGRLRPSEASEAGPLGLRAPPAEPAAARRHNEQRRAGGHGSRVGARH